MERRQSPRTACRFRCRIRQGTQTADGTVVDISTGGLAVRAEQELNHGDSVAVEFEVPGRGAMTVEAIVWHVRMARLKNSGKTIYLLGMMLAKAPDSYLALAGASRTEAKKAAEPGPEEAPPPPPRPEPSPATDPELLPYRLRLRHLTSPRTRTLSVDAGSTDEARRIAGAELGAEWEVLEVKRAARA